MAANEEGDWENKMIRISQMKLPLQHGWKDIQIKAAKLCKLQVGQIQKMEIVKQSIDARKKNEVCYVYTVDLFVENEEDVLQRARNPKISKAQSVPYHFLANGKQRLSHRPLIIGAGPAGLFCAYALSQAGYAPLILERGRSVGQRKRDVEAFWASGILDPSSNAQFGEGGAGTFSDGKLNTLIKDRFGRSRKVLETFVAFGASEEILYQSKPHIGTDQLCTVIENMRNAIRREGGDVCFSKQVTDLQLEGGRLRAVEVNGAEWIPTDLAVLSIGHSARDTFEMMQSRQIPMEAKAFAVGLRVEHPQAMIDQIQYKGADLRMLPPASYKLATNLANGRGVYSFCMCPGGYVVNASSEEGRLAVNGMSYHARDGKNANSAIIVTVTPQDFVALGGGGNGGHGTIPPALACDFVARGGAGNGGQAVERPLAGIEFQRMLEEKAFALGNGKIPQQLYGDFQRGRLTSSYGDFSSSTKGQAAFAPLHELLPDELRCSFLMGMEEFPRYIEGYNRYDAILSGVESRTSSPVRIARDEGFESTVRGLYPCGEGAGYAGGIMSAAIDGLKVAEAIAAKYAPL